ncbi:hypothetical protein Lalb_Chr07g0186971 [Lupinus albus]|uniref:Uncharacterized protein n=1 Tax=Lupinus albus TaxID=3870 RepID=A0A6A4QA37_LUPAL|nr:hypothetical protein Lalb_Chr07g0186971 [Lupinus albus]
MSSRAANIGPPFVQSRAFAFFVAPSTTASEITAVSVISHFSISPTSSLLTKSLDCLASNCRRSLEANDASLGFSIDEATELPSVSIAFIDPPISSNLSKLLTSSLTGETSVFSSAFVSILSKFTGSFMLLLVLLTTCISGERMLPSSENWLGLETNFFASLTSVCSSACASLGIGSKLASSFMLLVLLTTCTSGERMTLF